MTFYAKVFLNGVKVQQQNLGFRLELDDKMSHKCTVEAVSGDYSLGDVCEVYCSTVNPPTSKVFEGVVEDIVISELIGGRSIYSLNCTELFHVKASGILVAERFFNKKAGWIARYLVEKYLPDFDASQIEEGDAVIDEIILDYMSLLDALDEIASLSNSTYYATPDRRIVFKPASLEEEPLEVTANMILSGGSFKNTVEGLKNKVIVIGGYNKLVDQQSTAASFFESLHAKHFAQPFTPTQRNIMRIDLFLKKIGSPTHLVTGKVVEDVSGYGPVGARVAGFSFNPDDITVDGGWVSCFLDEGLREKKHWIIVDQYGDEGNTVQWGYTSNGEYAESTDGQNWSLLSGKTFAYREYYGEPVLEQASDPSLINQFGERTEVVVDANISDKHTAKRLALSKLRDLGKIGKEVELKCVDLPLIPQPGRLVRVTYPKLGLLEEKMRVQKVSVEFEAGKTGAEEVELKLVGG